MTAFEHLESVTFFGDQKIIRPVPNRFLPTDSVVGEDGLLVADGECVARQGMVCKLAVDLQVGELSNRRKAEVECYADV